jgi:hypothetical protein
MVNVADAAGVIKYISEGGSGPVEPYCPQTEWISRIKLPGPVVKRPIGLCRIFAT